MSRVRRNLERLVSHLKDAGFQFGIYPDGEEVPGYKGPLLGPDPQIEQKIARLEELVGGPIPLSLSGFWKWVGSVNLVAFQPELTLHGTFDPLWVDQIDVTLNEYQEWLYRRDYDNETQPFAAVISPDALHKDNVSGGSPYEITLPDAAIDAVLANEGSDIRFGNYLRNAIDWAGYPGFAAEPEQFPAWLDELSEQMERF